MWSCSVAECPRSLTFVVVKLGHSGAKSWHFENRCREFESVVHHQEMENAVILQVVRLNRLEKPRAGLLPLSMTFCAVAWEQSEAARQHRPGNMRKYH